MSALPLSLFDSAATVPPSGEVPREVAPGVLWDAFAEAEYAATVEAMTQHGLMGRGYRLDDAVRSARWAVEADLHRRCIRREIEIGERSLYDPEAKRALVARWQQEYGALRADELVRLMKSETRRTILKEW